MSLTVAVLSAKTSMIVSLFLMAAPTAAAQKDVPNLYSQEILEKWQVRLEPVVKNLVAKEIEPYVLSIEKKTRTKINVEVPAVGPSNDPFNYVVKGGTITIPTLSVKFLYDLFSAKLWLEARGFEDKSFNYVLALKYQSSDRFPGGRYLSPFEALGVSHNKSMNLTNNEPDITHAFDQVFYGALVFVIGHEVAHAVLPEKQLTAAEREAQADFFAFEMLTRNQFNPAGVILYFLYYGVWIRNAADYPTTAAYLSALENDPHPLTAGRLGYVGKQLVADPHHFYPDLPDSDPRIAVIKSIGSGMLEIAEKMHDLTSKKQLAEVARDISIESLAVHEKSKHPIELPK